MDEQSIASKSPISRFLMVTQLRRLDECDRSTFQSTQLVAHQSHKKRVL
jgi:hypothetical protein